MKAKKYLSILCAFMTIILLFTFVSCGDSNTDAQQPDANDSGTEAPENNGNSDESDADEETTAPPEVTDTTEEATEAETEPEEPKITSIDIGTADELRAFAAAMNDGSANYDGCTINITADIDLSGADWTPFVTDCMASAVIEGNNHTISNITINGAQDEIQLGFIKLATYDLTIQNITFNNIQITSSGKHAGGVIGESNAYVDFINVTVDGLVIKGGIGSWGDTTGITFRVGGLLGMGTSGSYTTVQNCTVKNIDLTGYHNLAALIGSDQTNDATVEDNHVENIKLNYSSGYSDNYDAAKARTYVDVFYNDSQWSIHTERDADNGNTYENVVLYDIAYEVSYNGTEGR